MDSLLMTNYRIFLFSFIILNCGLSHSEAPFKPLVNATLANSVGVIRRNFSPNLEDKNVQMKSNYPPTSNTLAPAEQQAQKDYSNKKYDEKEVYKSNIMEEFWNTIISQNSNVNISDKNSLLGAVKSLGQLFQKLMDVELGVKDAEDYYNSLPYEIKRVKSLKDQAKTLAALFSSQLKDYSEALERMEIAVKTYADTKNENFSLSLPLCCDIKPESLTIDDYFKTPIGRRQACTTLPTKPKPDLFIPDYNFGQVLVENSDRFPYLKWQYFVSPEGVQIEFPANKHNCKESSSTAGAGGTKSKPISSLKTSSKSPSFASSVKKLWSIQKSKKDTRNHRIVFLLDIVPDVTPSQIKSIKNIILLLIRFLDEADKIGIVNSETDSFEYEFLCQDLLIPVTSWTRAQIMHYIDQRFKRQNKLRSTPLSPEESKVPGFNSTTGEDEEGDTKNDPLIGIQKAINMACSNFSESPAFPSPATIIHLTNGLSSISSPIKNIIVECPVFIDTFFLRPLNTSEEENYKTSLQSIASKNIWRVQVFSSSQAEPESFAFKVAVKLNSKKNWWSLSDILSQFFPKSNKESEKSSNSTDFSFPHWNPLTKEAVLIAKKYVFHQSKPLGIVAIEIPLTYFTQHITYFVNENICDGKNYAFLMDKSGRVIAHPSLGRPGIDVEQILTPIQIENIETHHGFTNLKKKILNEESGCSSLSYGKEKLLVTYSWASASYFEYVVVLVYFGKNWGCYDDIDFGIELPTRIQLNQNIQLQHHQLLKATHVCNNQMLSVNKTAIYLSPSAFSRPADALGPQLLSLYKTKQNLGLMAYIGDNSGFLPNRGLKSIVIKNHIAALANSNSINKWNRQFLKSSWAQYILRRFASSGGGTVLLTYPAMELTSTYLPSSTQWFREALKKKIAFSRPKIDQISTVPLSTISQATYIHAKPNSIPVSIFGADINIGFFKKLLEELLPQCKNEPHSQSAASNNSKVNDFHSLFINGNHSSLFGIGPVTTRCFFMDEAGYIVYHPHLSKSLKTLSEVHVTQLEPLTIIDVVQHGQLGSGKKVPMKKHICHKLSEVSSTQGSLQRFYEMSMTPDIVVQNLKHGEQCSQYSIVAIPQTNLLLGIVHDGCLSATAFCPCSTIDNLCLNCLRMEPSDFQENFCECPCECSREPSFCVPDTFTDLPTEIEPCEFPTENINMALISVKCDSSFQNSVNCLINDSCEAFQTPCEKIISRENCIGAWNCDWCISEDTHDQISRCNSYQKCYGYAFGKSVNNQDTILREINSVEEDIGLESFDKNGYRSVQSAAEDDDDDSTGTIIIPVFAVLSIFLIFLGFVVYCYQHRSLNSGSNSQEHLPLQEQEQESPMCSVSIAPQFGSNRSDEDSEEERNVQIPVLNPYRVPVRERVVYPRSPFETDSDHGYSSTMTPHDHDDSECGIAPFPVVKKSSSSINTLEIANVNVISNSDVGPGPSTQINNQIVVPVTVHREFSAL